MGTCPSSSVDAEKNKPSETENTENPYEPVLRVPWTGKDKKKWVKKNISIKRCNCYVENKISGECFCGQPKRSHKQEAIKNGKEATTWDTEFLTLQPTDFYHEFPDPSYDTGSMFSTQCVRMDMSTSIKTVSQFLFDVWELKTPQLILSILGGSQNQIKDKTLLDEIKMGLKRIVKMTDTWMISDGLNRGVVKYVEKGLDDDKSTVFETIGVAYSGDAFVPKHKKTIQRRETWKLSLSKSIKSEDVLEFDDSRDDGKVQLDFNHKYLILVENTGSGKESCDVEYDFRGKLDQQLKYCSSETENEDIFPLVEILLGGKLQMLSLVLKSITNGIPVVVVKGTGGLADVIAYAVQNAMVHGDGVNQGNSHYVFSIPVESHLKELINGLKDTSGEPDVKDILKKLHHCCATSDNNLIKVFDIKSSTSSSFDIEVFKAVLVESRSTQKNQLYSKVVMTALKEKRLDLLGAILDEPVWNFFRDEQLVSLYRFSFKPDASIGNLIRQDFPKSSISDFKLEYLDLTLKNTLGYYFSSWYEPEAIKYRENQKKANEGNEDKKYEYIHEQLFLWAVLTDNFEISKMIWQKIQDPIASALVASGILNTLSQRADDALTRERLISEGHEYSQIAIRMLNKCFDNDRSNTMELLDKLMPFWGKTTCAMIAMESRNGHFIAQTACKTFSNGVWMGKIAETTTFLHPKVFLCVIFFFLPILIPLLIDFVPRRNKENDNDNFHRMSIHLEESAPVKKRKMRCIPCIKNIKRFYKAPIVKFYTSIILYFIFLILFSYLMLVQFGEEVSGVEIIVTVWIGSIFLEEIWQVFRTVPSNIFKKIKNHISSFWNQIDVLALVVFATGLGLRYSSHTEAARVVYATTLVMFFLRTLHIFSISKELGPQLVMMGKMLNNLFVFMIILMIYVASYSIAAYSLLYPNAEMEWRLVFNVLRTGYWPLYGELLLDEVELAEPDCSTNSTIYETDILPRCPSAIGRDTVPVFLGIYVLISNILLLNLLVAIFAFSVQKVYDNNDVHWSYQSFTLVFEYHLRVPLPPPLTIILWVFRIIVLVVLSPCICLVCCSIFIPSLKETAAWCLNMGKGDERGSLLDLVLITNKNRFTANEDELKPDNVVKWEQQVLASFTGVHDVKRTEESSEAGNKQMDTLTSSMDEIENELVVIKNNTTVLPSIVTQLIRLEERLDKLDILVSKRARKSSKRRRKSSVSSSDSEVHE